VGNFLVDIEVILDGVIGESGGHSDVPVDPCNDTCAVTIDRYSGWVGGCYYGVHAEVVREEHEGREYPKSL